jgi:hypothetical protein
MIFSSRAQLLEALGALGTWFADQPAESNTNRLEFFICGGACFLFHELPRYLGATNDVDVWCQFENNEVIPLTEWTTEIAEGIERVRNQSMNQLPHDWFNCEVSSKIAVHFGLPEGAKSRSTIVDFGPRLRVFFSSRHDLVAFKFLALIAARHPETEKKSREDLLALVPTEEEVSAAREWLLNVPKANQLWKDDCLLEFAKWTSMNHSG